MKPGIQLIVLFLVMAPFMSIGQNNPLKLSSKFTADPTARNWGDGQIWLYTSHDVPCMKSYSAMNDWQVFSSFNGVDWDDHGSVLSLDKLNQQGWNVYNAWAPDCVRKDSLFYLYFPVKGIDDKNWKIGVATSPYPKGPFERPRIVVDSWGIDPSVLVDDDGRAYLYCQFKMGELNADMSSVKEETAVELADVAQIPYEGYEGPFVFKRGQKYYYLCSAEGYKRLIYYMADQPLGPWAYMGTLMEPDTIPSENNHCSVVEFNGEWILFYHQRVCGKARKICADFLQFNSDGKIEPVVKTSQGISL